MTARCSSTLSPAPANLQSGLSVKTAAKLMAVSERLVYMARKLIRTGRTDLVSAVERDDLTIHAACQIAKPGYYAKSKPRAPHDARDLFRAAIAELDLIVAEGLAPGVADRLDRTAALIEEAMGELEGRPCQ